MAQENSTAEEGEPASQEVRSSDAKAAGTRMKVLTLELQMETCLEAVQAHVRVIQYSSYGQP